MPRLDERRRGKPCDEAPSSLVRCADRRLARKQTVQQLDNRALFSAFPRFGTNEIAQVTATLRNFKPLDVADGSFASDQSTQRLPRMSASLKADTREPKRSLASVYSITSSARASIDDGTLRSRDLAVFRLITRSYLAGACTGRFVGFSPLRMRST